MNRIMRNSGAALAAIFIAGSLTACGPGSASSSRSDTNPTEVSTDLGNKKYELTLWDGAGLKAVDEALIAGFEAKYPNITITGQYDPDNVSGQNGPRVISAKDAPDIARVTDMNSAVRGNHLVSLEAYVDAYGWDVPDSQTELYRVDSNGKLGSGDLYALPNSYSVTGIYFNTKLAEQLGIDAAPTSVEEFEADMQTAKDTGILPMMTYAKDGGTSFVFQALMANNSSAEDVQNWILQKSGTFDNQAAQDAASTLQDWNNKGYMPEGVNAVDASTALSRFCNGEGLFFPSGNWNLDTVAKALGDDVQFFAFPGATSEDEPNVAANAGAFYGIPVNAKNRDAAAAFLDYTQSAEAQQITRCLFRSATPLLVL